MVKKKMYYILIFIVYHTNVFGQKEFKEFKDSMNVSNRYFHDRFTELDSLDSIESFIWEAKFEKRKKCGKFERVAGRLDLTDSLSTSLWIEGSLYEGGFSKLYDESGSDRTYQLKSDAKPQDVGKLMFVVQKIEYGILIVHFFFLKENYKSKDISKVIFKKSGRVSK